MFTETEKDIIITALSLLLSNLEILDSDIKIEEVLKIIEKLQ